jgi:hypothetical protein
MGWAWEAFQQAPLVDGSTRVIFQVPARPEGSGSAAIVKEATHNVAAKSEQVFMAQLPGKFCNHRQVVIEMLRLFAAL